MAKKDDKPKIEVAKYQRLRGEAGGVQITVTNDPDETGVRITSGGTFSSVGISLADAKRLVNVLEIMLNSIEEEE